MKLLSASLGTSSTRFTEAILAFLLDLDFIEGDNDRLISGIMSARDFIRWDFAISKT